MSLPVIYLVTHISHSALSFIHYSSALQMNANEDISDETAYAGCLGPEPVMHGDEREIS